MNITGDYHTHSKYSKPYHAVHSVKDMVEYAEQLGLNSLGITDHGPEHCLYGINRKNIDKIKKEIEEINKTSKVSVFFGIEANLIKKDGTVDLKDDEISKLDYLIVGYHRGSKNDFYSWFRAVKDPEKQKELNTEAYINCLNKYKVAIISHLNEYIKVDVLKVATEAKKVGTLIELNNKHIKFTDEEANQLIESGCEFILSSDAHKKQNIAKLDRALEFVEKYNIPHERIVNIDKIYR